MLAIFLSLLPFLLFFILFLSRKLNLLPISLITLLTTSILCIFFWQINTSPLIQSYFKGALISLDIFFIIFGAILFLDTITRTGIIHHIFYYLESVSPDYRILVILLAWFFENFLEGTAGFGTPAVVVAPLLISLGLKPLAAVTIALLGNSSSVVFGAVGTPIRIGFAGINAPDVPVFSSFFNLISFIVPVFMLWFLVKNQKNNRRQFYEALPFALWSGIAYVVPAYIFSFFGAEFPAILGSVFGLALVLLTIRGNILMPSVIRKYHSPDPSFVPTLSLVQVIIPYLVLISTLILSKIIFNNLFISIPFGINYNLNLFNPGFAFITTSILIYLIGFKSIKTDLKVIGHALNRTLSPFLVTAFMSITVQLMVNSGQNKSGLDSIIALISQNLNSSGLPFWTPFIGAIGSFITGSATVSNLMFGGFLNMSALNMGLNNSLILSLQLVGASAGNMIAIADVMAAAAVVGFHNREYSIIKQVALPCLIYVILVAALGLFVSLYY